MKKTINLLGWVAVAIVYEAIVFAVNYLFYY